MYFCTHNHMPTQIHSPWCKNSLSICLQSVFSSSLFQVLVIKTYWREDSNICCWSLEFHKEDRIMAERNLERINQLGDLPLGRLFPHPLENHLETKSRDSIVNLCLQSDVILDLLGNLQVCIKANASFFPLHISP